jgi:uncharacterized protein YbjT (DUF2867 family)
VTRVAVLGATGYVGGRLVPRLLERGYEVVAIGRSLAKLQSRPWSSHPRLTLRAADAMDAQATANAIRGAKVLYYLVHSMEPQRDFQQADRRAAETLARAAELSGVERIIYLGGLGEESPDLSPHLRSRAEVSRLLSSGAVPVTTLRAAMIIGSGSASFEMLRYLVDRLPVMVTPRWISTPSQPIAIRNVLDYLIGCLECPQTAGRSFDIGGPDVLSYRELMEIYAQEAGLRRRWILPVPVFTPRLSSYWIHLVTPVPSVLARPLAEGLRNPVICQEQAIRELIPLPLLSCREAIRRALLNHLAHNIETHWTDAGALPPEETVYPGDAAFSGGTVYCDQRSIVVTSDQQATWQTVVRIGGETGWYYGDFLWKLRGVMDKLLGGVGARRGRRDPNKVLVGDALDFWRVLAVSPPERLRLLAEMKVPGQALLDFQVRELEPGLTEIKQTAWFVPSGLSGMLYWWLISPLHNLVFSGMLRGIARATGAAVVREPTREDPAS